MYGGRKPAGLVGVRVPTDATQRTLVVSPLLPVDSDVVRWFALRHIHVRRHVIDVVWDADGHRYGLGRAGLFVWRDKELVAHSATLAALSVPLDHV